MLSAADIVGLNAGDGWVHSRATLIILIASSLLNLDSSFGSTSSISFSFCCKTRACRIEDSNHQDNQVPEIKQHAWFNFNCMDVMEILHNLEGKHNSHHAEI